MNDRTATPRGPASAATTPPKAVQAVRQAALLNERAISTKIGARKKQVDEARDGLSAIGRAIGCSTIGAIPTRNGDGPMPGRSAQHHQTHQHEASDGPRNGQSAAPDRNWSKIRFPHQRVSRPQQVGQSRIADALKHEHEDRAPRCPGRGECTSEAHEVRSEERRRSADASKISRLSSARSSCRDASTMNGQKP